MNDDVDDDDDDVLNGKHSCTLIIILFWLC